MVGNEKSQTHQTRNGPYTRQGFRGEFANSNIKKISQIQILKVQKSIFVPCASIIGSVTLPEEESTKLKPDGYNAIEQQELV